MRVPAPRCGAALRARPRTLLLLPSSEEVVSPACLPKEAAVAAALVVDLPLLRFSVLRPPGTVPVWRSSKIGAGRSSSEARVGRSKLRRPSQESHLHARVWWGCFRVCHVQGVRSTSPPKRSVQRSHHHRDGVGFPHGPRSCGASPCSLHLEDTPSLPGCGGGVLSMDSGAAAVSCEVPCGARRPPCWRSRRCRWHPWDLARERGWRAVSRVGRLRRGSPCSRLATTVTQVDAVIPSARPLRAPLQVSLPGLPARCPPSLRRLASWPSSLSRPAPGCGPCEPLVDPVVRIEASSR